MLNIVLLCWRLQAPLNARQASFLACTPSAVSTRRLAATDRRSVPLARMRTPALPLRAAWSLTGAVKMPSVSLRSGAVMERATAWTARTRKAVVRMMLQALTLNVEGEAPDSLFPDVCGEDSRRCPEGTCVSARELCNGETTCSDGSDEPVTCGKSKMDDGC